MKLRKLLPLLMLSGILLVGCTNNNKVPKNNETPMQDVRDDTRQWKNNLENDIEDRNFDNGNVNDNHTYTGPKQIN